MPAHGYSPSVLETVAVVLKNLWVRFLAAVEDRLDLPRPREDLRVLESYPVPDVIGPICKRSPEDISFGDAVRALEGPLALVPCVSRTAYERCSDCADEKGCGIRLAMREVRESTARILDHMTLAEVNRKARRRRNTRSNRRRQ